MTEPVQIIINIPATADPGFKTLVKRVAGLFQALLKKWEKGEKV